ncbi:MAG TPA: tyrosine-type recombinase/integrase [Deinococcales bacterium]|nr:tyrosine-type recombinase/integrase [Deinococcales bacterium]
MAGESEPKERTQKVKARGNGEGTVFFNKTHDLWCGQLTVGPGDRRSVYAKTEREARRRLGLIKRQYDEGTLPEPHRMTVADLLDRYLKEVKDVRGEGRTLELYRLDAERYILPLIGHLQLSKVTPLVVQQMRSKVLEKHSPDAANRARDTLNRAMRQALRWRLIASNPVDGVDPLKVEREKFLTWEPEEVAAFLEHAKGHRLYALFYLALTTGMRQAELLHLAWADVTLTGLRPSIVVRKSKTAKGLRRIALSPDQVQVLSEYLGEGEAAGLVFPSTTGTPWLPQNLMRRVWHPLRDAAGVRPIRFHDLRHTYASLAIRAGMDVRLLADRLGHTDPGFTLRTYAHVFEAYRQSGALSLADLLDAS